MTEFNEELESNLRARLETVVRSLEHAIEELRAAMERKAATDVTDRENAPKE